MSTSFHMVGEMPFLSSADLILDGWNFCHDIVSDVLCVISDDLVCRHACNYDSSAFVPKVVVESIFGSFLADTDLCGDVASNFFDFFTLRGVCLQKTKWFYLNNFVSVFSLLIIPRKKTTKII